MSNTLGNWQAFPDETGLGMTYRDWLIGKALQGFASTESARDTKFSDMAHWAIQAADTVLEELKREHDAN